MAKKQTKQGNVTPPPASLNKKDQKLYSEYLKQQVSSHKASEDLMQQEADLQKQLIKNEKQILDAVNKRKAAQKAYHDISRELAEYQKTMTAEEKKAGTLKEQILKKYKEEAKLNSKINSDRAKGLAYTKQSIKAELEHNKQLKKALDHSEELVEKYEEMLEPLEEMTSWMEQHLPGGGLLSKALGIDKISEKIKKNVVNQLAQGSMAGKSMVASMAPLLPLLLAVAAVYKAFEFDKELTKFSKDLDIAKDDALALSVHSEHLAHEMHLAGVSGKEVGETMVEMRKNMGVLANEHTNELVKSMTALRTEMGMTAEESQAFYDIATALNMSVDQLSAEAGSMGENLLGAKETLKEISKLPKSVVIGFKGTSKELEKAVIKGKLLGMSLEKVAKIGEGMLDIESSIEKQFTAQVLTGKSLNLNAARQYALQGDYARLQDEILQQAGSLEEFQEMGPLQQKAMAEALGMSVDEMTTMLTKSQQLKDDYGLTTARAEELMKLGEKEAALLTGKEAAYYKMQQDQKKQQEATQRFQESLNKLMMAFEKIAMPVVKALGLAFDGIGWVIDWITLGIEKINGLLFPMKEESSAFEKSLSTALQFTIGIGAAMAGWKIFKMAKGGVSNLLGGGKGAGGAKSLTDAVGGGGEETAKQGKSMSDKLKGMGDNVKAFFNVIREVVKGGMGIIVDVFKGAGEALSGFFKAFSSISFTDLLKGGIALGIMAGSLWLMGEALEKFVNIGLDDLGIAALALVGLTAAVVGLGYILPLIGAGAIALGVMSAAFWIFGEAAASVAEAMPGVANGFKLFGDINGDNLLDVAAGIGALSLALAAYGAGGALSGIGSAVGKFFDEDPVEKFKRFAEIDGDKLIKVATGISTLNAALAGDTSMAVTNATESVSSGGGGGSASGNTVTLKDVKDSIDKLVASVSQPTVIKFGSKTIEEFESQINLKKSYTSQVDRGYGVNS